jgi:molybdate transport system substrate-binding protein
MRRIRVHLLAFSVLIALSLNGEAGAAEVKVIASAAVKEAIVDRVAAFEKSSDHKVTMIWAGTEAITKRISGGEIVDVVLIAAANIDRLISEGKLVVGSRTDVAKSGIGVAVRARSAEAGHLFR